MITTQSERFRNDPPIGSGSSIYSSFFTPYCDYLSRFHPQWADSDFNKSSHADVWSFGAYKTSWYHAHPFYISYFQDLRLDRAAWPTILEHCNLSQMMSLQDFLCFLPVLRFWESSPSHFVSHFCMSGSPNWAWHFPISRWNQMKWLPELIPARHVCLLTKENIIILMKKIYTCMLFIFHSIGIMTRSKVCVCLRNRLNTQIGWMVKKIPKSKR